MEKIRHRRHSTELKLRLAQAYLNGEGSLKSIAKQHDISHALLMIWVDKFRRGELTEGIDQDEKIREYEAKIAALERKVGQLTMEIDVLKKLHGVHSIVPTSFIGHNPANCYNIATIKQKGPS